jgi:hypothetical protein
MQSSFTKNIPYHLLVSKIALATLIIGHSDAFCMHVEHDVENITSYHNANKKIHPIDSMHLLDIDHNYSLQRDGDDSSDHNIIVRGETNDDIFGGESIGREDLISSSDIALVSSRGGNVSNNTVIMSDNATITHNLYGGYSEGHSDIINSSTSTVLNKGGNTYQNNVKISDSTINNDVYGGYSLSWSYLDNSSSKETYGTGGDVYRNSLNITKTSIKHNVYGGYSQGFGYLVNSSTDTLSEKGGNVSNNTVTLNDSFISNNVYGGYSSGYSYIDNSSSKETDSTGGNVSNNNVNIRNTTIEQNVYGGYSESYGYIDKSSTYRMSAISGNSSRNHVTISDGARVKGNIYGGYTIAYGTGKYPNSSSFIGGSATQNIVTLIGDKITINGDIYGGFSRGENGIGDMFSGNRLNLQEFRGTVNGIHNFEYYNYILPKDVINGMTLIKIHGNEAVDLSKTKQSVGMVNDGNRLNVGDKIILIDKVTNAPDYSHLTVNQGFFTIYDVSLRQEQEGDHPAYILRVNGNHSDDVSGNPAGHLNPISNAFSEGRAAGVTFINQGSDFIADYGVQTAQSILQENKNSFIPFLITNSSSSHYGTNPYFNLQGFNLAAGLAAGHRLENGNTITLGSFFENGQSKYNSSNRILSTPVQSSGNIDYLGTGILFRIAFAGTEFKKNNNNSLSGLYIDTSMRTGQAKLDFFSRDIIDGEGYRGRYNSKTIYYSLHSEIGYIFNLTEKQLLDIYSRALLTEINGDTVVIGQDRLHFNPFKSKRLRIGSRYTYSYNKTFTPYSGIAYEHEFKGDINADAYGFTLNRPSLKGNTGVLTFGFTLKPIEAKAALSIDISADAYIGARKGSSGTFKINYAF